MFLPELSLPYTTGFTNELGQNTHPLLNSRRRKRIGTSEKNSGINGVTCIVKGQFARVSLTTPRREIESHRDLSARRVDPA